DNNTSARMSSQRTSFTMRWWTWPWHRVWCQEHAEELPNVNIILIGAQGSGKGTQAELLATHLQLKPCASGELLRTAIAAKTPAGLAAKPYYDRGDLVPDHLVIDMILDAIRDLGTARGLILDGFPRNFAQAQALDASMAALGERIDKAIYLEVPRDI